DPGDAFNPRAAFFKALAQDPVLSQVKMIAEPWDLHGDFQGAFPAGWSEWNGRYRDCLRRFWRGDRAMVPELASRLSGSSDLFWERHAGTTSSVNFVTCHDGFTLHDLVTYERKHNEDNGEENADGTNENYSRNWGAEGESEAVRTRHVRDRTKRNFLASLFLSQGVPMLLAGDEIGRTQAGNNNAYCQDNELGWVDWEISSHTRELLEFVQMAIRVRKENPVFQRRAYFEGDAAGSGTADLVWLRPDGKPMVDDDWRNEANHVLGMLIDSSSGGPTDSGGPFHSDSPHQAGRVLLMMNGGARAMLFRLPRITGGRWRRDLDTSGRKSGIIPAHAVSLNAHSLVLATLVPLGQPA
ncbi:MAG: glycogen debranching protein GlgX, partial [Actinomycetota bacterium]